MRLYLVQHGEALAKEADPDRPLSDRGHADAARLADVLYAHGMRAAGVFHSGKTRARQTAEALAAVMAADGACAPRRGLDPLDDVEPVAAEAEGWDGDTVLVGHLPFIGRLASRLVAGDADAETVALVPGAMLCLERAADGWAVAWMLRPELLPD